MKNSLFILLVLLISAYSNAFSQSKNVYTGYYFIIKVKAVNNDAIEFKTIEIYQATKPAGKLLNSDGKEVQYEQSLLYETLCKRNVVKGYFKGLKKKHIGKIVILHSTGEFNPNSNEITFDKIVDSKSIDLNLIYLFTRDCNQFILLRYMEGKGGYDIYTYNSLEYSSTLTFNSMNKEARSRVLEKLNAFVSQNEPGVYEFEAEIEYARKQSGSLLSDFGTAFGSCQVSAKGKFNLTILEDGKVEIDGNIYYTFGDNYKWHSGRDGSTVDHTLMNQLSKIGAKQFGIRGYYEQTVSGKLDDLEFGDFNDSKERSNNPVIKNYYSLKKGSKLIKDFTK